MKCIIVEDEVLAQNVIQSHLHKTAHLQLTGIYSNALEAKQSLKQQQVDLIFLDIQLPGMTGLNFLRSLTNPPLVILTTAYAEYALESYDYNVVDYLLKPISFERFSKAINKIGEAGLVTSSTKEKQDLVNDHIFIKSNGKFIKLNFSEIIYIEGMKDYLKIFTATHKLITHRTMGDMEKALPSDKFVRVHKSYIIALAYIRSVYKNSIDIENTIIPIGSVYKDKMMNVIERK